MNTSTIISMIESDPTIPSDIDGFVARMNALTVPHTNTTLTTSTGVLLVLGLADGEAALRSIEMMATDSAVVRSQITKLNSTGLDFSHPLVHGMLDQAVGVGAMSSDIAAKLKSIGLWYTSIAQENGGECTRRNVEDAISIINKRPLLVEAERRYQAVISAIGNDSVTDTSSMIAAFSAILE